MQHRTVPDARRRHGAWARYGQRTGGCSTRNEWCGKAVLCVSRVYEIRAVEMEMVSEQASKGRGEVRRELCVCVSERAKNIQWVM